MTKQVSQLKTANSALRNAGSRFGITVKHNLDNDFYVLGRLEFRFDDTESRDHPVAFMLNVLM